MTRQTSPLSLTGGVPVTGPESIAALEIVNLGHSAKKNVQSIYSVRQIEKRYFCKSLCFFAAGKKPIQKYNLFRYRNT
jgi:hypothetical protein